MRIIEADLIDFASIIERRIPAVVNPDNLFVMVTNRASEINAGNRLRDEIVRQIQQGHMPAV